MRSINYYLITCYEFHLQTSESVCVQCLYYTNKQHKQYITLNLIMYINYWNTQIMLLKT